MLHVKDNFAPGSPVGSVPAAWYNKVGSFINGLIGGYGIRVTKNERGASLIEVDPNIMPAVPTDETGTPTSAGSMPTGEVTQAASTLWTSGGSNGAEIQILYRGNGGDTHTLYAAKLTISKDGLITKIEAVENGGMEIQA